MLDRASFLRPMAHRGLHDRSQGRIENTAPAFEAAIAGGYGIECDLRPAADGLPIVFHDETLDRLVDGAGPVAALGPRDVDALRYKGQDTRILRFAELLDLVGGRVPLLVEVKSEWDPPDTAFLSQISALSTGYRGPIALMCFDPAIVSAFKSLATGVPRGIVSGGYKEADGRTWWGDRITDDRATRLANLAESGDAEPHFYAYHVKSLPHPAVEQARHVFGLPIFTWTVRTAEDRTIAAACADAPIFEGCEP